MHIPFTYIKGGFSTMELYTRKQRATNMLKKVLAVRPVTMIEMRMLLLENFGLSNRFLKNFLEIYENNIEKTNGVYKWKNITEE